MSRRRKTMEERAAVRGRAYALCERLEALGLKADAMFNLDTCRMEITFETLDKLLTAYERTPTP